MGSWLHKLMSRNMKAKTKNKDQPINSKKNNRKMKIMRNITLSMDHYP